MKNKVQEIMRKQQIYCEKVNKSAWKKVNDIMKKK